jgi:spore coat polysaccharide biosynthesis predicted glycosyltransferase SpsG
MNALIVCQVGSKIGLGHLSRSIVVAKILKKKFRANVKFLIQGDSFFHKELISFKHNFFPTKKSLIKQLLMQQSVSIIFFDLHPKMVPLNFIRVLKYFRSNKSKIVAIDGLIAFRASLDLIFIPSFHCLLNNKFSKGAPIIYGWDCFLLDQSFKRKSWLPGQNVIALTGGSDVSNLGKHWLKLLNNRLPKNTNLDWVVGPYASRPVLKEKKNINVTEYISPDNVAPLMQKANYAVTVFGVAFFELLKIGIPTVVFPAIKNANKFEIDIIKKSGVAIVAKNEFEATELLAELMSNNKKAFSICQKASGKLKNSGDSRFYTAIVSLLKKKESKCH